jgi:uncharacterized protein
VELTPEEGRVLGCLVEKQLTTPQHYPLTDNALIAACNQSTSRDPVVSYDLTTVRVAVRSLRENGLLRTVHRSGERSDKHQHELPAILDLTAEQVAVLAVLLLRGPQTAAELRARTERMRPFSSVEEVERVLAELRDRRPPLAVRLDRQPGRREDRWAEVLVAAAPVPAGSWSATDPDRLEAGGAGPEPDGAGPAIPSRPPSPDGPGPETAPDLRAEVGTLRAEVAALRAEVSALRADLAAALEIPQPG